VARFALLGHSSADAVVAYRAGAPLSARQFLHDVLRAQAVLGEGTHVLNACADRYHFTVGFAAALTAGKVTLLPSTHTPEVIRQLQAFAPDAVCLTDAANCAIRLPQVRYPAADIAPAAGEPAVPQIEATQLATCVFTSGSTGTPVPYPKTFGPLCQCVLEEAQRLGIRGGTPWSIVATVPPQHMYGFESSVLMALANGHALCAEHPFYPADIAAVLESVPRPRALISTPVHLRALLGTGTVLPPTELIVSATAPLSQQLAGEVEQRFGTRLMEIYGSTETGQVAARRPTAGPEWQLWPGVRFTHRGEETWADGGHIEQPTRMCDVLEVTGEGRFLLHGRLADLVNIAGKRSSLAYLTQQLNLIPGVEDGAFFHFEHARGSHPEVSRVAAAVVAPDLDAARLFEALRQRIDPVFLPRPLLLVPRLPRNATGKLPLEALQALAVRHLKASSSAA
jgi:acyl-coenzyme A synthetase/AMP-(fatty) acid ligase